jgi:2-oxoisovalerate dehydrogenase E2 component (dihydrolipoyl transacylase)
VFATPAVRRICKENNIDLSAVVGSGPNGRVLKEDVLAFLEGGSSASHIAPVTSLAEDTEVPIRGMMRTMIKTMTAAATIPQLGYKDEIEMDRVLQLRQELKADAAEHGIKLTMMPIMLKALSMALLEFPSLNASLKSDMSAVVHKARHNLGFAMDTKMGLVVPNIKDVQQKTILEIAAEMNRLQADGERGLNAADLSDGTFTLSNIGSIGGTYTMPVILPPEVVIGGLGKVQTLPRYNERMELVPKSIVQISWSADHRVVDGATIARFSNCWKGYLENPATMISKMR